MVFARSVFLAAFVLGISGLLCAQEKPPALQELRQSAMQALRDRNYELALQQLEQLTEPEDKALAVRVASLAKQPQRVIDLAEAFLNKHSGHYCAGRVRLLAAQAHRDTGQWPRALATAQQQLKVLEGDLHKRWLTGPVLEQADRALAIFPANAGPAAVQKKDLSLDYKRAVEMLELALRAGVPEGLRPEVLWKLASAYLGRKQYQKAWEQFQAPELIGFDARKFRMVECLIGMEELEEALRRIQEEAVEEDDDSFADLAVHLYRSYSVQDQPYDSKRESMQWLAGAYAAYEDMGEVVFRGALEESSKEEQGLWLQDALATFPEHRRTPEALLVLAKRETEARRFSQARQNLSTLLENYRENPNWPRAQKAFVSLPFLEGEDWLEIGDWRKAALAFDRYLELDPSSSKRAEIALKIANTQLKTEEIELALKGLGEIVGKYPYSKEAPRAHWLLAQTLEHALIQPEKAFLEYQQILDRYPKSKEARQANKVLRRMQQPVMRLSLPVRVAVGEEVALELEYRQLESVVIRAFPFDPETYLRRNGKLEGFTQLDLDLVEAAWFKEVALKPVEAPQIKSREISLEIPSKLGSVLLTVESGTMRALVPVLRSDFFLIAKASPHQVLALAVDQNQLPVAGVRVALARGGKLRFGETGQDGTVILPHPVDQGPFQVVAFRGDALAIAEAKDTRFKVNGSQTRIHLATDRRLYSPGDVVQLRTVVREAVEGRLQNPAGGIVHLWMDDGFGQRPLDLQVRLNAFGTASAEFQLPMDVPWRRTFFIEAEFRGKKERLALEVRPFLKPDLLVSLEPRKEYWLPGEQPEAVITLRHPFGAPAKGLKVRVDAVWDGGQVGMEFGPSDEMGKIHCRLPKQKSLETFFQPQELRWDCKVLAWSGKVASEQIISSLSPTDLVLSLALASGPCFHDEAPSIRLYSSDPAGRPRAAVGELSLRRKMNNGREWEVGRQPLLAERNGQGFIRWPEPLPVGNYRLVWSGLDSLDNRVEAALSFEVRVRRKPPALPIRLQQETVNLEGDLVAEIENGTPGAPLLLTLEAEDILDHRMIRLDQQGRAQLSWSLPAEVYPNAWLRAAGIQDQLGDWQLVQGEAAFQVNDGLSLEIRPQPGPWVPGAEVEVEIWAKDLLGRPASAELSLAVVDQRIFQLHDDPSAFLPDFLRARTRKDLVQTHSSVDWRAPVVQSRIPAELLAERHRREKGEGAPLSLLVAEASDPEFESNDAFDSDAWNSAYGVGGGAGGSMGARGGGARKARGMGGGAGESRVFRRGVSIRRESAGTAYFHPHLRTDDRGRIQVRFTLPEELTRWRIAVQGVDKKLAAAESQTWVQTSRPFHLTVAQPGFLRSGDQCRLPVWLRNAGSQPLQGAVVADIGGAGIGRVAAPGERWNLAQGENQFLQWDLFAQNPGRLKFQFQTGDQDWGDGFAAEIPVLPATHPQRAVFSGLLGTNVQIPIEIPEDAEPDSVRLELKIESGLETTLLSYLSGLSRYSLECVEQSAHRVGPAAAATIWLDQAELWPLGHREQVMAGLKQGLQTLAYAQNDAGGWGWWPNRPTNEEMTSLALSALGLARRAGFRVSAEALEKGQQASAKLLDEGISPSQRASLFLARSLISASTGEEAAVAFRLRDQMEIADLAKLKLAFRYRGSSAENAAVRRFLEFRLHQEKGNPVGLDQETLGWLLWAFADVIPGEAIDASWLGRFLAFQKPGSLLATKALAPGLIGLAKLLQSQSGTVGIGRVFWTRGQGAERALTGRQEGGLRLVLDSKHWPPGTRDSLKLRHEGTQNPPWTLEVQYRRKVESAPSSHPELHLSRKGRFLLEGEVGTGRLLHDRIPTTSDGPGKELRLQQGELLSIRLRLQLQRTWSYVLVEEPLPAGFELVGLPEGNFDHWQQQNDRLLFFYEQLPAGESDIHYRMRAVWQGNYRTPGPRAHAMYRPELWGEGFGNRIEVVADGALRRSPTEGLSPETLLKLAQEADRNEEVEDARTYARALLEFPVLEPVARECHLILARNAWPNLAGEAEHHFRRAEELDPLGVLEMPDLNKRVQAQMALRQWPEAWKTLHTVLELHYSRARQLVQQESFLDREDHFRRLYVLGHAFAARGQVEADAAAICKARLTDLQLDGSFRRRQEALQRLQKVFQFFFEYPESAQAPKISRKLATLFRRFQDFESMWLESQNHRRLYPTSPWLADADYDGAVALFGLGRMVEAEAAVRKSLEQSYKDASGNPGRSPFHRDLLHLQAQIAHARGDWDQAIRSYRQVRDFIPEADRSLKELTQVSFDLPERIQVQAGETVEIPWKRLRTGPMTCELYRIDLLNYLALGRNPQSLADLRLHGLHPLKTVAVPASPPDSRTMGHGKTEFSSLAPGAYLAIFGGEELHRSTLILVSDLVIHTTSKGRAYRGQVLHARTGKPVPRALVQVGGAGGILGAVRTDARGIFELSCKSGKGLMVVAKFEDHLALVAGP